MPKIENWAIIIDDSNPFIAPELCTQRVQGYIYDDEKNRFPDGSPVATSGIIEKDFTRGIVKTRNTIYTLGKIDPVYEQWIRDNELMTEIIEEFINKTKQEDNDVE